MLKALLFDMDGVLVDSEELSISIGIKYFESKGYKAEEKNFLNHLGTGMRDFIMGPAMEIGVENAVTVEEADAFYSRVFEKELEKSSIAMPHAKEVLENAKAMGFKIAICSSAQRWKVNANIRSIGLDPSFFDLVIAEDMIKRNKSFPDIYLLAIASLGVDNDEAVVFEDSEGGVKAGLNAEIPTVALMTTMGEEKALHSGANRVIKDISELKDLKTREEFESYLFPKRDQEKLYGASYVKCSLDPIREEVINNCISSALKARDAAYSPYSNYKVGAAVLSAASGKIYSGSNIENSSFGATICAERNAITTALTSERGVLGIDLLVVASEDWPPAPPCAVCLQVIAEFANPESLVILVDTKGHRVDYRFKELLPNPFIFPSMRK